MGKDNTEIVEEDGYVAIKWSEYKELLTIKGKYEELTKRPVIEYVPYAPNTFPYIPPSPIDLTPKVTFGEVSTATNLKQ